MTQYYQISETGYPVISSIELDGFTAYEVGSEPQELLKALDIVDLEEKESKIKSDKLVELSSITVTTSSGKVFDGREKDIPLMSGAINASTILGITEHQWKLHDNTVALVTVDELKEALALSMQAIGAIKVS